MWRIFRRMEAGLFSRGAAAAPSEGAAKGGTGASGQRRVLPEQKVGERLVKLKLLSVEQLLLMLMLELLLIP